MFLGHLKADEFLGEVQAVVTAPSQRRPRRPRRKPRLDRPRAKARGCWRRSFRRGYDGKAFQAVEGLCCVSGPMPSGSARSDVETRNPNFFQLSFSALLMLHASWHGYFEIGTRQTV